jgi:DNA-binding transcriptional LysR family regulator
MTNIANLDLNLLRVLYALLAERNVTRAARRLHLSQPATSNALARLRHAFRDPLLVRGVSGLVLTPRAHELTELVRRAMQHIDAALNPPVAFDPATADETFTIAAADSLQVAILGGWMPRLAKEAPGVVLRFRPLGLTATALPGDIAPHAELANGELDLAVGAFVAAPRHLHTQALFEGGFVCVLRKDHPLAKGRLTLRRFLQLSHILVDSQNELRPGLVDIALANHRLTRRVALVVPQFTVVPYVVAQSDLIVTLPKPLADRFARTFDLRVLDPPLELPKYTICQVWHERTHHSPKHRWLRGALASTLERPGSTNRPR